MATNKTSFLNMNDWVGTDPFKREEINANFRALDAKAKEHNDKIGEITSSLTEKATQVAVANKANKIPVSFLQKVKNKIPFPVGFTWTTAPINIYRDGTGAITTDLDASTYKLTGKTYYVSTTGNNANDGLTPGTALKSITNAIQKSDVVEIEIGAGTYYFTDAFNGVAVQKNITLRAASGADVKILAAQPLTWTKTAGQTNVYQTTRSIVATVWDASHVDSFGDYSKLTSVASIALCDSTPESYYYDTGTNTLYVHTFDNRAADANIIAFLDTFNFKIVGNYRAYLENLKLYGGNFGSAYAQCVASTDTEKFVAKGCEFKYSSNGNGGVSILGYDAIIQNCVVARNYTDGFNYHFFTNRIPKVLEVGCTSRRNGIGRGYISDNASTIHDGGKIIRVNNTYYNCEGPLVADVDANTESWNIGIEAHHSVCTNPDNHANYYIDNGTMWLDTCIGYGSNRSFVVASTGKMYTKNALFDDGVQYATGIKNEY